MVCNYFSGSDGLIKLWNVKKSECTNSFDQHSERVWTLSVSQDENTIMSGGADSKIVQWKV